MDYEIESLTYIDIITDIVEVQDQKLKELDQKIADQEDEIISLQKKNKSTKIMLVLQFILIIGVIGYIVSGL